MPFRVTRIRRHPVKSMGGEDLNAVKLDARGLAGDRWFAVRDEQGRLASGKDTRRFRRHDEVFGFRAVTRGFTVEVGDGATTWVAGSHELDEHLSHLLGTAVQVLPEHDIPHQDGGQVSLVGSATLAWCERQWGVVADPRRLRVNLVVETTQPFVEESWLGRDLAFPLSRVQVVERIRRCRTIDVAQDGAPGGDGWLQALGREREGCLGVYASVVTPGSVRVGDQARLVR